MIFSVIHCADLAHAKYIKRWETAHSSSEVTTGDLPRWWGHLFLCLLTIWLFPPHRRRRCSEDKECIARGSARAVGITKTLRDPFWSTRPRYRCRGSKFVADASEPNSPLAYAEPHSLTSGYLHRDTKVTWDRYMLGSEPDLEVWV
jgi:hypothetical protein